jgi:hypothetical protein
VHSREPKNQVKPGLRDAIQDNAWTVAARISWTIIIAATMGTQ